jgi:hypothetical protein
LSPNGSRKSTEKYHKKAGEFELEQGKAPGDKGPFQKPEKNSTGTAGKGRVIAPVVGAFAEMSPDTYAIVDLILSVLANEHCSFFSNKPSETKGISSTAFNQWLYRSLGLAAQNISAEPVS